MDKYINIAGVWILKEATQSAKEIFSHLEGEILKAAVDAFKEATKPHAKQEVAKQDAPAQ